MKKIALLLFFVYLAAAAPAQQNRGLLFGISGNGLSKPSYLFGTIHLICPQDYRLSDTLKATLQAADRTVLELDMDDPALMTKMQQQLFMPDGQTLQTLLTPEAYQSVKAYFTDSLGMPFGIMEHIKPFALTSMLFPKVLNCPVQSYEMDFVTLSKKDNQEVLGLETVEEQMAVMDEQPLKKQAEDLAETITDMAASRKEFREMVQLYLAEDTDALHDFFLKSDSHSPEFEEKLINQRNQQWLPKIITMAAEAPTFFAVGAGHLGGQNGLLTLLRQAGYTLTPIE